MSDTYYSLDCGNLQLVYRFHYPETRTFFGRYLKECDSRADHCDISVTPEYMEECRWLIEDDEPSKAFLEFQSLMIATGNMLLGLDHALFHGVALLWKGNAWIITAPSGTGKTTQARLWKKLLQTETRIINGDKPILECRKDGSFYVYSSPWRGKEKYGVPGLSAPLKGIILLEQGSKNQIFRMKAEELVLPFFGKFVSYPENEEQILCQAEFLRKLINDIPVWKLINIGDEDSAALTIETLEKYLEGRK